LAFRYIATGVVAFVIAWLIVGFKLTIQHWLAVHTGTVNEGGPYYGFWSGFAGDLGLFGGVVLAVVGFYRVHECHNTTCKRIGTHTTKNGHKLCKKCIVKPLDELDVADVHPDHK
jgi:hypothetical protein